MAMEYDENGPFVEEVERVHEFLINQMGYNPSDVLVKQKTCSVEIMLWNGAGES